MGDSPRGPAGRLMATELVIICPSLSKACGIAEYTQRVAEACRPLFGGVTVVADSAAALTRCASLKTGAIVLLQHEYGLLDFSGPLSSTETTSGLIANLLRISRMGPDFRVGAILHSMVFSDARAIVLNQQWATAGFPIFCLSRDGARAAGINALDHGIFVRPTLPPPPPDEFRIGAFGFLSPNKDVESVLRLCAATRTPIQANFASRDPVQQAHVLKLMAALKVDGRITFDFMRDPELFCFLSATSVIYQAQHDFAHYATSGSARLAVSTGRPVIVPPCRPFHDLAGAVIFADGRAAADIVRAMKANRERLTGHAATVGPAWRSADLGRVYGDLAVAMLDYRVWCGGSATEPARILSINATEAAVILAGDEVNQTEQNHGALARFGLGLVGGRFCQIKLQTSSDPAGPIEGEDLLREAQTLSLERYFAAKSEALERSIAEEGTAASAATVFGDERTVETELRMLRGLHTEPVAAFEVLALPAYCQALLLWRDAGATLETVVEYLRPTEASPLAPGLGQHDVGRWILRLDRLKQCSRTVEPDRLTWRRPGPLNALQQRGIIYPSSLLGQDENAFAFSLFAAFYNRGPSPIEFATLRAELGVRLTRTQSAILFARTAEAVSNGVQIAGSVEDWINMEMVAEGRVQVCVVMAPRGPTQADQNADYRDRLEMEALIKAASAPSLRKTPLQVR